MPQDFGANVESELLQIRGCQKPTSNINLTEEDNTMATRRKLDIGKMTDAELESAVLAYKDAKESEKAVKKAVSDYGTQIKEGLQNRNETEFIAGDIRAYITITENSEVNELQAIEILRKALTPEQFAKEVKTREYIDDDEMEKLVYAHELDAEILSPAVTPKAPTVTLRLGKVKK